MGLCSSIPFLLFIISIEKCNRFLHIDFASCNLNEFTYHSLNYREKNCWLPKKGQGWGMGEIGEGDSEYPYFYEQ